MRLFASFSRAVFRCMDAAVFCFAWMSSAVLYWIVSRFLARLVERKCYSYYRKIRSYHCSEQLFTRGHGSGNLSIFWEKSGCLSFLHGRERRRPNLPLYAMRVLRFPTIVGSFTLPTTQKGTSPSRRTRRQTTEMSQEGSWDIVRSNH